MTTKKYRGGGSWTTQDEIDHLADLGSFDLNSYRTSRLVWLQAYLDAMPLRVDWQKIDQCVVRNETGARSVIDSQSSSPAVIALEARIIADEQAMTPEQRAERWLRLETEAEKHGAFTRVW